MTVGLTQRQLDLLTFIARFQHENDGVSPSYQDMAGGIGLNSRGQIHGLLTGLEERGHLRRMPGRHRAIELINTARPISRAPDGAPLFLVTSTLKFRSVGGQFRRWPTFAGARRA